MPEIGFRQRKLMTGSVNITMSTEAIGDALSLVCDPFCDPLINHSGYCISPCLNVCPMHCHHPILPIYPVFSPPPSPRPPPVASNRRHVSTTVLVTVSTAIVLLVLVCFFCARSCCRRRGRRRGGGVGGRNIAQPQRAAFPPLQDGEFLGDIGPALDHPIWYIHTVGLPPSAISKIALCKYKSDEGLIEGTDCSVCLTEFEEDETLRLLPKCSHAFHVDCIDTWLRSHTNCPNCRAPITTSTAHSPSPGPSNANYYPWEEIRLDQGRGDTVDVGREFEETEEVLNGNSLQDVNLSEPSNSNGIQAVRRSVSLDSQTAAKINFTAADFLRGQSTRKPEDESGDVESQDQRTKRMVLGESFNRHVGRSVQFLSGSSSSTRRSLSLSGRFTASKHGRNWSSLLPL
ncbi:hypothetical protein SAY87_014440 [Trapa incisa]|uniref:RING-type E3 ubiquitin transferase n=1 Tax=Trapa incisa TaxID=236973 RepID=A0AAN7GZY7_9MYRT|nr:hypothetical protein SAY87_014440 [Trapa incisa]